MPVPISALRDLDSSEVRRAAEAADLLAASGQSNFDRIARLAATSLRARCALVCLLDEHRAVVKSYFGIDQTAAVQPAVLRWLDQLGQRLTDADGTLAIEDLAAQELGASDLATSELGFRSVLAVPLRLPTGSVAGLLCAVDEQPRSWSDAELTLARDLADCLSADQELRMAIAVLRNWAEEGERQRQEKTAVLNSTSEGIYGVDLEHRCTSINRAAAEMLGYEPNELIGRRLHGVIHHSREDGSPYPESECPILASCNHGESVHLVRETLWRRDGSSFLAEYSSFPVHENGELKGAVVTFRDTTEHFHAQEALHRSERFARQIIESSQDCIKILDCQGRLLSIERRGQEHLGIADVTPYLHNSWLDFWQGADREAARAAVVAAAAGGTGSFQGYCETFTGKPKWWDVQITPIVDEAGVPERLLAVSRDITERRKTEEALRLSERRFRALMEQSPLSTQIFATDGSMLLANHAWEELWGVRFDQIRDYNILHDPQLVAKGIMRYIERGFAGETVAIPEILYDPNETAPGHTRYEDPRRWVRAFIYPVKNARGVVQEVVLVHEDMTQHKQAEEALQQAREELEVRVIERTAELARANAILEEQIETRQAAEAALQEEREFLRAVLENTEDSIVACDADGVLTLFNRATRELHGLPAAPLSPEQWTKHYALYRADGVTPLPLEEIPLYLALNGEQVKNREMVVIPRGQPPRTLLASGRAFYDSQGRKLGAVVSMHDITERKRAEAERARRIEEQTARIEAEDAVEREQQRGMQLRGLAAASLAINASLSLGDVLQTIADKAAEIIGAHQSLISLVMNQNWQQALHAASISDKYADWRESRPTPDGTGIYSLICQTNRPLRLTSAELQAHPQWKALSSGTDRRPPLCGWLAAPLVGRHGENLGLIQLTDKREGEFTQQDEDILVQLAHMASLAIQNSQLYHELQQADRRKDEFLAMLAHELRNPLAPIRSGLDILRLEEANSEMIDLMTQQVGHLVRLVDDLLDVSRIMRGKVELRKEPVELSAVIARAVEMARPLVDAQKHELTLELPSEAIWLNADPVRLSQVIANLLNNAAKYTDRRGRIWLVVERDREGVTLRVRDNGIGIEPSLLPHVFELFTQADRSIDRSQGGLGIGLTLVHSLVEMHDGTVTAHSAGPGQGSEFSVHLPLQEKPRISAPSSAALPNAEGRRLLVVDDNRGAARMLALLLQKLGSCEVQTASDGLEALESARLYRPEIIVLDIGLPRMDGYEVARRLRQMPEFDPTLLVALTGYGQEEDRRRAIESGFDVHLVKPPSIDMLRDLFTHPKLGRNEPQR